MIFNEPDFFWDDNFLSQDMLPAMVFDSHIPNNYTSFTIEASPQCDLSEFSSRLPCLVDNENRTDPPPEGSYNAEPWLISESCYERLRHELEGYSSIVPVGCSTPSRSNLIRYLEKYLVCGQEFLPFIHIPTFVIDKEEVELVLAMAAIGALYLFERSRSYECYFTARAIIQEKIRREDQQLASEFLCGLESSISIEKKTLSRIQTFVLLVSLSSWGDKLIARHAAPMSSQLAALVRDMRISESDEMPKDIDWLSWVAVETKRRILFGAYVALNLQTIAFNTPPLILNHEVKICLPGYAMQWKSKNASEWQQAAHHPEFSFQEGLRFLFEATGIPEAIKVSSFSNYLLIHGIVQQTYVDRNATLGIYQPKITESFETALRNWQIAFERGDEPALNPTVPKDAMGLMGAAILRLGHIRLRSKFESFRLLQSTDLHGTVGTLSNLNRSPALDQATLHAAHGLSIPVRLGTSFMARTKTPIWTIEHSLCSLECALFLRRWLEMMSTTTRDFGVESLSKVESKLLAIVTSIIRESNLGDTLDIFEDDAARYQRMAGTVVKLWAEIFQGSHVHDIDNTISAALQVLAETF